MNTRDNCLHTDCVIHISIILPDQQVLLQQVMARAARNNQDIGPLNPIYATVQTLQYLFKYLKGIINPFFFNICPSCHYQV